MEKLIRKYVKKLSTHKLALENDIILASIDDRITWSRRAEECGILEDVINGVNISSLLFAKPAEPYRTIIDYLASINEGQIYPTDCETRTFLHDLPVTDVFDSKTIIETLKRRKTLIIKNKGVVTSGTIGPEQAFVNFSSLCFASYVKFFSDFLDHSRKESVCAEEKKVFEHAIQYNFASDIVPKLMEGPINKEEDIYKAISEAGKATVENGLVDSYFGNISMFHHDTVFISQTGSSLDELDGLIDPCPVDNSACFGITASSELSAHKKVYELTEENFILHGHPKFSVIMSMDCREENCNLLGECFRKCPVDREIDGISIVPGEVGTGKYGLCNTVPKALIGKRGVLVYGHGLFTSSKIDFNLAFKNLMDIEIKCREIYLEEVNRFN